MSDIEIPAAEHRYETENHNPYHGYVTTDGRLTSQAIPLVGFAIRMFSKACHVNADRHGWWEEERNFGEMLALMHSELSEALEAWRDGDDPTTISYEWPLNSAGESAEFDPEFGGTPKAIGVASEFADVIIRILDTCYKLNIPVAQALIEKHAYNFERPYRHGGKLA